jgi:hypothetical protein
MVNWPAVCLPTEAGGPGVLDMRLAGIALHTRWLWLQRTDAERAWAALEVAVSTDVQSRQCSEMET